MNQRTKLKKKQKKKEKAKKLNLTIQAKEWLKWHNYYRCLHNSPPLEWDRKLEKLADMDTEEPESAKLQGYNYFYNAIDIENAVKAW